MALKTNLELVNLCDQFYPQPETLYQFLIDGYNVSFGRITENIIKAIPWEQHDRDGWKLDHDKKTLKLVGSSLSQRNEIIDRTLRAERGKGNVKNLDHWYNEVFPVYGPNKEVVVNIEHAGAQLFGILTYGIQLLAYQDNPEGPSIWIARRAKTKRTFPGMLDSMVGGSLRVGESAFDCLLRECVEETSIPADLVRNNVVAVGMVNYVYISDERVRGDVGLLCPEVQFTYEMKVPKGLVPIPADGEADEIVLLSVPQLKEALAKGEFTPANGCIVLDFFVRHGILTFENEPDYIEIAARLHRRHDFQTA